MFISDTRLITKASYVIPANIAFPKYVKAFRKYVTLMCSKSLIVDFGFRSQHSTTVRIRRVTNTINKALEEVSSHIRYTVKYFSV